jgi:predicted phosphodiesterase
MGRKTSPNGELVKKIITKFPNASTRTLAKMLYEQNPENFNSYESARSLVKKYRNEGCDNGSFLRDKEQAKELEVKNIYNLPESSAEERKPFVLPLACNNILLISDLHIPYHTNEAIKCAFDYGIEQKVNTIFINGDLIDFCQISRFEKDPKKRSVKYELDCCKQFFVALREVFPTQSIYWLKGNHDIRLEAYLRVKAPELLDVEEFYLEHLLKLNDFKVTIIPDNQLVKAGKLSITHGHHIMRGFFAPVNSARGVYMKAKQSTIIGHVHKVSEHSEINMDGEMVTTWSTGCLCELKPDYSPMVSNYAHGFAHIKINTDKTYSVTNKRIYKGKLF